MNAEYLDDGFDIIITMEIGDKSSVSGTNYGRNYFYVPYIVAQVFEALANSIDFTIDEYMDDCGYFYSFGEPILFGNDYGVYPFVIDSVDVTCLYYLTPENIDELQKTGNTKIESV